MAFLNRRGLLMGAASGMASARVGRVLGAPAASQSRRAASVTMPRWVDSTGQDALSPMGQLTGTITPSDLHFSRHHFGAPEIDPAEYELCVHGLVERPTVFTLEDLKRLPGSRRVCFVECAGNGAGAFRAPRPTLSAQAVDGATSNSEWVGVSLSTVLARVGVLPEASWFLAESCDAGLYARSIPLSKAYDDALLAYAQNGEPLRVEQGYPIRLLLPGWEGSASVKWLRRIKLLSAPAMTRHETARYSDVSPDGRIHPFQFVMGVKSIIVAPSYPQVLSRGAWEIRGLAWSGRGRVTSVQVSTDGGVAWAQARLDEPVLPMAHTGFRIPWSWDGRPALLMSRAADESGTSQPTLEEFRSMRPPGNDYRNNYIRAWRVTSEGQVFFASGC